MIQNLGTEEFQTVFKLPKDQHSVKLVEEMVDKKWGETPEDYATKIQYLDDRMAHQDKTATNILKYKTVKPIDENNQTKTVNGKEYDVHSSENKPVGKMSKEEILAELARKKK